MILGLKWLIIGAKGTEIINIRLKDILFASHTPKCLQIQSFKNFTSLVKIDDFMALKCNIMR